MLMQLSPAFCMRVAKVRRSLVVVASGFHFLVACLRHLAKRAVKVFRQQIAHRIELQSDGQVKLASRSRCSTPKHAAAATAPEAFKKVLREELLIFYGLLKACASP